MILDARASLTADHSEPSTIIIGAGTVGLLLAERLAAEGQRVIIVEAGGEYANRDLNSATAVSIGRPHAGPDWARAIGVGGTSVLWGGQLAMFEPSDLRDPEVPWPLSASELQPAYRQVFEYLGLRDLRDDATLRAKLGGEESDSGTGVERFFSYWMPQPNFVVRFASTLRSPDVAIYTYATVIGIDFDGDTAVSVAVISRNGRQYRFYAKTVVVAAGTIGSNRLMLSLQRSSAAPWKDNANVGAYFHDHLGGCLAGLEVTNPKRFRDYFETGFAGGFRLQPKLRLNAKGRRGLRTGVSGRFVPRSDTTQRIQSIKQFAWAFRSGEKLPRFSRVAGDFLGVNLKLVPFAYRMVRHHRIRAFFDQGVDLDVQAEQVPLRESRIVLTDKIAPDGMFRAGIDWRVDGQGANALRTFLEETDRYVRHRDIGRLVVEKSSEDGLFLDRMGDTAHQCGGLRMARDAALGVTDGYGRVYGTTNLYVAGPATFPTSSSANITLTALAMALRLAHLLTGRRTS
jgi:choline dehydrogenase-like flavoprotein